MFFPRQFTVGVLSYKKRMATLTGRAPELCGWALCPGLVLPCPPLWLGSVSRPCPPLVLVARLCVQPLSSSCPLWLCTCPLLCPGLVLLFSSVAGPCPPLGRNSLAGLCGWALCPGLVLLCPLWLGSMAGPCPPLVRVLSSSCSCLGRAPELSGWCLWPG